MGDRPTEGMDIVNIGKVQMRNDELESCKHGESRG